MISIAIDGPSGAGKSTVASALAARFGFANFDTGALYRTAAYYFLKNNLKKVKRSEIKDILNKIHIDFEFYKSKNNKVTQKMFLNGEDVTSKIRTENISRAASTISAQPEIRDFLLNVQREVASKNNIIMDGRDIGTIVLPNADIKIFLTAAPEVRAMRRLRQLERAGKKEVFKNVLKNINERDFNDASRECAPLKPAEGSIIIDNSNINFKETIEELETIIRRTLNVEQKNIQNNKNPNKTTT